MVSQAWLHAARRYRKPIHARKKKRRLHVNHCHLVWQTYVHTESCHATYSLCNAGHFSALFCQNSKLWFRIIAVDGGRRSARARSSGGGEFCAHTTVRCVCRSAPVGNNGMRNILPPCKWRQQLPRWLEIGNLVINHGWNLPPQFTYSIPGHYYIGDRGIGR